MQDLRIILIILGAVAIAALLIHGLWTSQKGRQKPMREKPIGKVANGPAGGDDFDRDGIGKVRVLGARKAETLRRQHDDENDWQTSPHFSAINDDDEDEPGIGLTPAIPSPAKPVSAAKPFSADRPAVAETELQQRERQYRQGEIDPLFDEPAAPAPKAAIVEPQYAPEPEPELASEPVHHAEPESVPAPAAPRREVPKTWQDVYVINLVARPNQQLAGGELARALTDAGFCFGDMDIFHRHQTPTPQGEALFSLINMVKPGTFNPNAMAQFSTPGVSMFMQLPAPGMAKNHFNLMVQTAENMAEDLDALLLDGQRSPLSPDYLAHCREQLRDYDSQAQ
ncbi:cell division protein ZipA [Oceanisphaera arctica]|uniref:Cell division protein ZipA n=1 Tax=Oceanisphaera arctica TaxID=641510 RepID=A0A2P5TMN8_9GAMM|nr:cell division protein ZipA [Oceanisphaera arctica]PPL16694.1 cell division protein ZipA [Oceanisphaera arctica]GHA20778.1 cell division protein ZipA [Oceanisphaera arctica]